MAAERLDQSYYIRDKVLRLCQYTAVLCDGLRLLVPYDSYTLLNLIRKSGNTTSQGVAASISSARLVFRLLNTASTLNRVYPLCKSLSTHLKDDLLIGILDFLEVCTSLTYNPTEQLMWAGQVNLLNTNHTKLSIWCTRLWIISIVSNIIRTLKRMKHENEKPSGYQKKTFLHILTLIQSLSDLINSVHYLPIGFLWSNQLSPVIVGVMGMISSAIGLYKLSF